LDDTNTTIQLEESRDWVEFTLDKPLDAVPGEKWVYSSGGSQLMSAVIHQSAGRHADDFPEEFLFRSSPRSWQARSGGRAVE
jgi:CubicO group peptidase (beta-lactamase class C family)